MNLKFARGAWASPFLLLALGGGLPCGARGENTEMIVVADRTEVGKKVERPTPGHPVYYIPLSAGFKELGGAYANDVPASEEDVHKEMESILNSQGYLPATTVSPPPTLIITYSWGSMTPATFGARDPEHAINFNPADMRGLIGAEKMNLSRLDPDRFRIESAANEGRYFVIIGAYDYDAFARGKKNLLWRTKLSARASGTRMTLMIPTLLAAAGPMLGVDNAKPVFVQTRKTTHAEVILREPQVQEYLPPSTK